MKDRFAATASKGGAITVVLVYAVVASLWILLSDRLMGLLFTDSASLVKVSLIKGWFFVAVTTLLLYYLVRRLVGRIADAHRSELEALQARQDTFNLLTAIVDNSDDAIFAKDRDGRYLLFNAAASRYIGKAASEVVGRDDRDIFPPDQAEKVMAIGRRVMATGLTETNEETLDTALGRRIFMATKGPLRDADNTVFGLFGISRDITARKQAEDALRESNTRFQDVVASMADWVWEVDAAGRYTYVSDSVENMLGYTSAEILGKTPFDLMPADEAVRVAAEFNAIAARKEAFRDLDNVNVHKDGSLRHVQTNGIPILAADGSLLGYRGLDRDITARWLTEQAVRESEARWIMAIDGAGHGVWDWNVATSRVYFSHQWKAMLGFTDDEVGDSLDEWSGRIHPDDREQCMAEVERHFRKETPTYVCEHRVRCKDGSYKWILDQGRVVGWDADGKPARMIGTHTDITALKQSEVEQMARNEELERFNRAMVDRELDMLAMKIRINALSGELGRAPPYPLAFIESAADNEHGGNGSK